MQNKDGGEGGRPIKVLLAEGGRKHFPSLASPTHRSRTAWAGGGGFGETIWTDLSLLWGATHVAERAHLCVSAIWNGWAVSSLSL